MAVTGPPPKNYDFKTRVIGGSRSPLCSPLMLPARDSPCGHNASPFHHLELCAHDESIVIDFGFVNESNRRIRAATRGNRVIRAVNKLDAEVFAVTTNDPKVWPIVCWTIGG